MHSSLFCMIYGNAPGVLLNRQVLSVNGLDCLVVCSQILLYIKKARTVFLNKGLCHIFLYFVVSLETNMLKN